MARRLLPKERIRVCLLCKSPADQGVRVMYSPARASAHLAGLMVCGSVWVCPVCAARVSEVRRGEVGQAVEWLRDHGMTMVLLTFTLAHRPIDSLEASLAALNGAYRRMLQRSGYRALRVAHGLTHAIKAVEVTWGLGSGWHPHLHVLQAAPLGLDARALRGDLAAAWLASLRVSRRGDGRAYSASTAHGVDVRTTYGDVQEYVSKMGRSWQAEDELTKANSKKGREGRYTSFDLLRSVRDSGDEHHAARYVEYAAAMKGTHQLRWSPGFRQRVGLGADREDAEIAAAFLEDDQLAYTLAVLGDDDWAAVRYFDARADLERVGDTGDRGAVLAYLAGLKARYWQEGWFGDGQAIAG